MATTDAHGARQVTNEAGLAAKRECQDNVARTGDSTAPQRVATSQLQPRGAPGNVDQTFNSSPKKLNIELM